jgi:hypothetical protein
LKTKLKWPYINRRQGANVQLQEELWAINKLHSQSTQVFAFEQLMSKQTFRSGLPDGLFSNPKNPKRVNFSGPSIEKMLICFKAIWKIIRAFGLFLPFCTFSVPTFGTFYSDFGTMYREKSGNPVFVHKLFYSCFALFCFLSSLCRRC